MAAFLVEMQARGKIIFLRQTKRIAPTACFPRPAAAKRLQIPEPVIGPPPKRMTVKTYFASSPRSLADPPPVPLSRPAINHSLQIVAGL
jgi:hypothetical protein